MNLKKITSLTMLTSMLMMTYTGLMLFIAPPGRVANWANWELFGLTKEEYAAIHSAFMVMFIVMTILHIYYNWKPLTSYLKNSAREMVIFTKETVVALSLTVLFFLGTLYEAPPFENFIEFGTDVSDSWIETYGEPPYGHAELSSLKSFARKMGVGLETAEKLLKDQGIAYDSVDQTLKDIGENNNISPEAIYQIISNTEKGTKKPEVSEKYTGLGRKKITEVAQVVGLSTEELIAKLKTIGIDAKPDDRFKEIAEENSLSPLDIVEKLEL